MDENYAYIKGIMSGEEVVSIPIDEYSFHKFVNMFEHKNLSDKNCKIMDESDSVNLIKISITDRYVLSDIHKIVNDRDRLFEYILYYLANVE